MSWNWGTKIALVFTAFCIFIIFLVVKTFQQDIALVSDDYYLQEIQYQNRINEISNAASAGYEVEIVQNEEFVEAIFPAGSSISGELHFYRPDNEKFDRKFEFSGKAKVDKKELAAGRYKLKISWTDTFRDYFTEKIIYINR